jgi:hypothetical protein
MVGYEREWKQYNARRNYSEVTMALAQLAGEERATVHSVIRVTKRQPGNAGNLSSQPRGPLVRRSARLSFLYDNVIW